MDELPTLGVLGALIAGATGSLHCALMCGPLACAGAGRSRSAAASWQLGRLASYSLVGALLGATGSAAVSTFAQGARPVFPWVMAAGLLITALELGKRLAPLPGLRHVSGFLIRSGARVAPPVRAAAMGAATPLLPCGLLYGISLSALAAGSALGGLAVMGAFALGGLPALLAVQLQLGLLPGNGRVAQVLRRAVPVAAALVLVWRAVVTSAPEHHCH
jgi:sulfite exporter TauE/SafE